ncbi:sensor histidine kinase [Corynebacterium sp. HMSC036D03]|uniref:sensor histidine kinase n=1 Tax=Corynebacterium sp. HMSC036D03 TaxID=1715171 RepID=UPI000A5C6061|nr:histidine kinase [Corynebacterium sp. HMSC036D03]
MEVFSDRRMIRDLAVSLLCGAASLIGRDLMSRPLFDYLIIALVVLVPIISRRWPRLVVFVASVVLFASLFQVELTVGIIILAGQVAYIIRRRLEEPLRRIMTIGMLAADFIGVFWVSQTVQEAAQDIARRLFVVGWSLLVLAVCMLVGELRRRAEEERTREISRALEKQRLEFEKSSTEQRAFIAREIHDVVTHSLSVIVAQADGALYTKDTEAQEEALKSISRVGRTSLREMRGVVGLLRTGEKRGTQPMAGFGDLSELINSVRSAGIAVGYRCTGTPPEELSAATSLSLYRIVQEALTNANKHGGGQADVLVEWLEGIVRFEVRNGYMGDARGEGHGIAGMKERAELVGGTFQQRSDAGTWIVEAELPTGGGSKQ